MLLFDFFTDFSTYILYEYFKSVSIEMFNIKEELYKNKIRGQNYFIKTYNKFNCIIVSATIIAQI